MATLLNRLGLLLLSSLLFVGCASKPSQQELSDLDYGPAPENYEGIFREVMQIRARAPDDLQVRNVQSPKKVWVKQAENIEYYYLICGEFNDKNSLGEYKGFDDAAVRYNPDGSYEKAHLVRFAGGPLILQGWHKSDEHPCEP